MIADTSRLTMARPRCSEEEASESIAVARSCTLYVRDVTEETHWSEAALHAVSVAYSELARPHLSPERVYETLCAEAEDGSPRAHVLAAFAPNQDEPEAICGTVRLVMGQAAQPPDAAPPIEALQLMQAPRWPHDAAGATRPIVAEITRFVIAERYRGASARRAGMPECITRALWRAGMDLAARQGATTLYAIMPTYVARLMQRAGIALTVVEGCQLNEQDDAARRLFDTFQVYWRHGHPRLYAWPVEAVGIAHA
jgi:hypothetical protein